MEPVPLPFEFGAGCLVAQGLGDALGFLVEGQPPAICHEFVNTALAEPDPPSGIRSGFAFGQYSDDTQLARELGLSLVACGGWDPNDFAQRVGRLFAENIIVGRGQATQAAAHRILAGTPWGEAGEPSPSAGNGAAMRAAPVGLFFTDPAERLWVADEQARVTHLDPRSRAAAILVADVVALALHDGWQGGLDGLAWLASRVQALDPTLAHCLAVEMPRWLQQAGEPAAEIACAADPPLGSAHHFERWQGISPFAIPSVLYALYAFLSAPLQPEDVLARSVAVGGDVDTVAAMAGAMTGARSGLSGLGPRLTRWAGRLTDQGYFGATHLAGLGAALAQASASARQPDDG
jgi:ADP-ribosylglycohydrolase